MTAEAVPVFVLKFRGGLADGVYRLARGVAPPSVLVERGGERVAYVFDREEPQTREVYRYDAAAKTTTRSRVVEAYYQIYRPAAEQEARADG